jgi:hypothetical protein
VRGPRGPRTTGAVRSQQLVGLRLGGLEQLVDVGVGVGQHPGHRAVEHRVDGLRVGRLTLDRNRGGLEEREVLARHVLVRLAGVELLLLRVAAVGEQQRLGQAHRLVLRLGPGVVELALAGGELLEGDPLQTGLDLLGGEVLAEEVTLATAERALGGAVLAGQRGHRPLVVLALELLDDRGGGVGGADEHADLAAGRVGQQIGPLEELTAAHAVVAVPHVLEVLEDLLAHRVVEVGLLVVGRQDLTALRVELGGEVPATGVAGAVLRVARDAATQRGDLLGRGAHVGPGLGRVVDVQTGLGEQGLVVEQTHRVVLGRDRVDLAVLGEDRLERRVDAVPARDVVLVRVLGDVHRLAGVQHLLEVGHVAVEDIGHRAAGEAGGEVRRVVALLADADALDRDVGVGLLERRDVVVPVLQKVLLRTVGLAVDRDDGLAGGGLAGVVVALGGAGGEAESQAGHERKRRNLPVLRYGHLVQPFLCLASVSCAFVTDGNRCDLGLAVLFRGGDDTKSNGSTQEADGMKKKRDSN